MKKNYGNISVDTKHGRGTEMRVSLPDLYAERTAKSMKPVNRTCTVLVIEDEEMVMDVSKQMLERLEYRVLQARNGSEADSIIRTYNGDIDLAIMDVNLPDMMGGTLYPVIIKERPNMKVIVSSGYDLEGPVREILDAGAKGFIKKPYSLHALSEKLNEVMCAG